MKLEQCMKIECAFCKDKAKCDKQIEKEERRNNNENKSDKRI